MGIGQAILAGLAIDRVTKTIEEANEEQENQEREKSMPKETPDQTVPVDTPGDQMSELVKTQQKSNPSPKAVDGYDSTTVTLKDGQTAIITTRPRSGLKLKVTKVYFDRRNDFTYSFLIDGDQFGGSNSNLIEFESPRMVSGEGKVVAYATNNSGTPKTIDWEIKAWGEPYDG